MILGHLSWFPRALGTAEVTLPGEVLFKAAQEAAVRVRGHVPEWIP